MQSRNATISLLVSENKQRVARCVIAGKKVTLTNAALTRCVIPRPSSKITTEPSIQPSISFSLSGLNDWQHTCVCNGMDVTAVRCSFDLLISYMQISMVTSPCGTIPQSKSTVSFTRVGPEPEHYEPFGKFSVPRNAIDFDSYEIPH